MPSWHFSLQAPRIPVPDGTFANVSSDGRVDFFKICSAGERQDWSKRCAEMLAVTPYFEDLGTTHKPKKTAQAVATVAYPLGERNALLMALLSKVLLRYF